jgi:hypothetical protein
MPLRLTLQDGLIATGFPYMSTPVAEKVTGVPAVTEADERLTVMLLKAAALTIIPV